MIDTLVALATVAHPAAAAIGIHTDGGILSTLSSTNDATLQFVKNASVTIILIMFIWSVHKAKWAIGAIVGGVVVAGFIFWGLNGGLQWLGTQFQLQWS
jgi:hypothetical protein